MYVVLLHVLTRFIIKGGLTQFMCIIYIKTPCVPGGLSSGQTGEPNHTLKAGVL